MRRLASTALLVVWALLALPTGASAHSLVRTAGGLVSYTSADATSLNTVVVRQNAGRIEFRDESVDGGMDPGPCVPGDVGADGYIVQTFCSLEGVRRVRVDLGDREDRATVTLAIPVTVLGGSGADVVAGGEGADEVSGGEGNDSVAGGAGDDVLSGDAGVDILDGGDGADRIVARDGEADRITCGPGVDTLDADGADAVAADCETATRSDTASPAAVADDGRPPVVDAGAPTVQRLDRSRVVRVYATTSKPGTLGASGSLNASGIAVPIKRVATRRVPVAGGGAELKYRLAGREWRLARRALKRSRRVLIRLSVVATDLAGRTTLRRAPAVELVSDRRPATASAASIRAAAHPEPGDVDGDEVRDEVDNCPTVRNGSQLNTDGEGEGDACDADDDNDGVPDGEDNCRVAHNPDQTPLAEDPRYGAACPPVDSDRDGVIDTNDNCDFVANDQADLDGDDKGDACDTDRDGDHIDDQVDNCPTVYNLEPTDVDGDGFFNDQLDGDGDGVGTACDPDEPAVVAPSVTSPGPPSPPGPRDVTSPRLDVAVGRSHRLRAIRAGLVVRLRCSEACAATVEVAVGVRTARRLRLGAARAVAGGSARLGGAGTTYAFVRFKPAARRALRRAGRGRVRATLSAVAVDAAANRQTWSRPIALRP